MFSASFEPKDKSLRPSKAEIQNSSSGAQYNYLRKKGRGRCKREILILVENICTPLHNMANGRYLATPKLTSSKKLILAKILEGLGNSVLLVDSSYPPERV